MANKIRLLIVDDYPVVISGLVSMLKGHDDIELVGNASTGMKAVAMALKLVPDVVLMNLNMPEMDGIESARLITSKNPNIHVLIFSGLNTSKKVLQALNAGALGFVPKDANEVDLVQAIRQVARGQGWLHPSVMNFVIQQFNAPVSGQEERENLLDRLTDRELDVLRLMTKGYSNQEIAGMMVLSATTVHSHVSHILAKLEVASRTQAVIYAMQHGIALPGEDETNEVDSR